MALSRQRQWRSHSTTLVLLLLQVRPLFISHYFIVCHQIYIFIFLIFQACTRTEHPVPYRSVITTCSVPIWTDVWPHLWHWHHQHSFFFVFVLLYNMQTLSPHDLCSREMSTCVSACVLWGEGEAGAVGCVGAWYEVCVTAVHAGNWVIRCEGYAPRGARKWCFTASCLTISRWREA